MGQVEFVSQAHRDCFQAVGNILKTQMADFMRAHVDQKRKLLQRQPKPKPARKMVNIKSSTVETPNKVDQEPDEDR